MNATGSKKSLAVVLATVGLVLLAFGGKAFTIDDTLFLKLARHLQEEPVDFYAFDVNWYGIALPMHEITKNPPLAGYYIAAVASVFGWSEWVLHLAFLLPALLAAAGTYALAARFTSRPALAALAGLITPVFLVSSTNVMCDTPMLAFWCWSIWFWLRGMDRERSGPLWIATTLAGLAFLTKYFGVCLVPLLFADGWMRRRRLGLWAVPLLVPLAFALGYQLLTDRLGYGLNGGGLLTDAASFATGFQQGTQLDLVRRTITGLCFAGGCLVPLVALGPALWSRRTVLVTVVLALLAGAWWLRAGSWLRWDLDLLATSDPEAPVWPLRVGFVSQFLACAAGGASLFALLWGELRRRRDPDAWLLVLWVGGTFVFATFVNWVNNGRSNLPMAPVLGILLLRRFEYRAPGRLAVRAGAAIAAAVAIAVTWGDYRWANSIRESARFLVAEYGDEPTELWFQGHWGFQYYMEAGGARPLDVDEDFLHPGDKLVLPGNNVDVYRPPGRPSLGENVALFDHPAKSYVHTMQRRLGASFYASNLGPLPFVFGPSTSDSYLVFQSKAHFQIQVNLPFHFQGPGAEAADDEPRAPSLEGFEQPAEPKRRRRRRKPKNQRAQPPVEDAVERDATDGSI